MADGTSWLLSDPSNVAGGNLAPEDQASCVSRYTFSWSYPTIARATCQGCLQQHDLPLLPQTDDPGRLFDRFAATTAANSGAARRQVRRWGGLLRTLVWTVQRRLCLTSVVHGWFFLLCMTANPALVHALLQWTGTNAGVGPGLLFVGLMTLSLLGRVACQERCWHTSTRVMNNARSIADHAVFRKSLVGCGAELDAGELTNYMATDADKLGKMDGFIFCFAQWTWTFASLPIVVLSMSSLVGLAATLIVLMIIILGLVVNKWLAEFVKVRSRKVQDLRDRRAQLMNELVRGIRTIKLQVWEDVWHARVNSVREEEMHFLVTMQYLNACNNLAGSLLSLAVPAFIFSWHILVDGKVLDSTTAFATLAWISVLQSSLQALPWAYAMFSNLAPSVRRLENFLLPAIEPEEHGVAWHTDAPGAGNVSDQADFDSSRSEYISPAPPDGPAIVAKGAVLGYRLSGGISEPSIGGHASVSERTKTVLLNVELELPQGALALVVGEVGCGKSTLLASLVGARAPLKGSCRILGSRAYAAQKPFLLNASLKDNILFTKLFDENRYQEVIRRTALGPDLQALAKGDATQVGEHGVQLSGGQKARVALARALYSDAEVVVCDDVLSAVDAHTAAHLWEQAILDGLVSRGRTVVLATHQIQYLSKPKVSHIVILKSGPEAATIWWQGPWCRIQPDEKNKLLSYVGTWQQPEVEIPTQEALPISAHSACHSSQESELGVALQLEEAGRAMADILRPFEGRRISPALIQEALARLHGRSEETSQQGMISFADFSVYLSAFGSPALVVLLAIASIGTGLLGVMANVWLSIWTSSTEPDRQQQCLAIYVSIGVLSGLCCTFQSFLLTRCSLQASRRIHASMLRRLLRAPLSFFDTVATGRILNRFLQDLDSIDNFVPNTMMDQMNKTLSIIAQLSLIYAVVPWVLVMLPFMMVPYIQVYRRVRIPNRDTKRIEATAHAPVYAHFGDALAGRDTIRAYGLEKAFVAENLRLVGAMASGKYGNQAVGKWAQATLTQRGCLFFLGCGVACVCLSAQGRMSGSRVGLVLLYASSLIGALTDYMIGAAVLESQFVSVERVAEYTRLPEEPAEDCEGACHSVTTSALADWLPDGAISMCNVHLRYAPHLLPALRGVSFDIPSGSKVALCGRTGCGKSSLLGVLTRLYPPTSGSVTVGGRDISAVPLRVLRHSLRVVAQDAILMSGTVAENLRPGGGDGCTAADESLCWEVLRLVGMDKRIASAGGLTSGVMDGGGNFSVGERQLLALARALMPPEASVAWRPPPILLCDEATASVDLVADGQVHETLLSFGSTVLMICHRLQYIKRFGLVACLSCGRVAEYGCPEALLAAEPPSQLAQLCKEAGIL